MGCLYYEKDCNQQQCILYIDDKKLQEKLIRQKIESEQRRTLVSKHYSYWRRERKFWIQQWKDIINKGKTNLEISIENKIMELDDKLGEALDRIYSY